MKAIHLTDAAKIAEIMVRIEQAGEGYRLPLLRVAAAGHLAAVAVMRGQPVPARYLTGDRPTVVTLHDDHPDATGPGRWKQVRRLLRWAHVAFLHATGGDPRHYAMIAECTVLLGRVLVIEMQHQHHAAWRALVEGYGPRLRLVSIVPPPGDTHPRGGAPAGETVQ